MIRESMLMADPLDLDPEKLRRALERHGVTIDGFAEQAGIGVRTLYRFLNGEGVRNRLTQRAIEGAYKELRKSKR